MLVDVGSDDLPDFRIFKDSSEIIETPHGTPLAINYLFSQDRYDLFTQPQAPNVKLRPESLGVQDVRRPSSHSNNQQDLVFAKCTMMYLKHVYPLVINHGNGKSPINGGFNRNIIHNHL